jgi:hypothetical protein
MRLLLVLPLLVPSLAYPISLLTYVLPPFPERDAGFLR